MGFVVDKEEGLVVIGDPNLKSKSPGVGTLLDGNPANNFLKRALAFNPGVLSRARAASPSPARSLTFLSTKRSWWSTSTIRSLLVSPRPSALRNSTIPAGLLSNSVTPLSWIVTA